MKAVAPAVARLLAASAVLALLGCDALAAREPAPGGPPDREDLRIGYQLLADTLADESRLRLLKLFKTITFRGPVEEVGATMDTLARASKQRAKELAELRELAPDVTGRPAKSSPVGDAIQAVAKEAGKDEMMDGDGFNLRFMLLQAQATRMVAAMAEAIAVHDPNARRQAWLHEVAAEYEGHRDEIVAVIQEYVAGRGADQPPR
ncbi:MAG: hypothetical protein ACQGVC_12270 [Myxococcota bacterium]